MQKNKFGKCKLCGREGPLTFEHVPPESAFNKGAVRVYPAQESIKLLTDDKRKPWELDGLANKIVQRGSGDYFLCSQCNSNTGSWYISEYTKFANIMHTAIQKGNFEVGEQYSIQIMKKLHPMQIFKAIMTMFCDINYDCFRDERLRQFLLNKESMDFNGDKYKVFIYLVSPSFRRILPYTVMFLNGVGAVACTEISSYPLGMILYINKPLNYQPKAICINDCLMCSYDSVSGMEFNGIPYYEINNPMIIGDFRSKAAIEETIKKNKEVKQENEFNNI